MVVADCRAILPTLQVFDDNPELAGKLLYNIAEWCLRYTPVVAVDRPDGLNGLTLAVVPIFGVVKAISKRYSCEAELALDMT